MNLFVLITFLVFIVYFDARYQEIPNWLSFGGLILGWVIGYSQGIFLENIVNSFIGFSLLFLPYIFNWVGAGDIKFLAALGSLSNLQFLVRTTLYGLIFSGVLALIYLLSKGKLKIVFLALKYTFSKKGNEYEPTTEYIPLGACISFIGLLYIFFQNWGV